jgi:hypothetical protein
VTWALDDDLVMALRGGRLVERRSMPAARNVLADCRKLVGGYSSPPARLLRRWHFVDNRRQPRLVAGTEGACGVEAQCRRRPFEWARAFARPPAPFGRDDDPPIGRGIASQLAHSHAPRWLMHIRGRRTRRDTPAFPDVRSVRVHPSSGPSSKPKSGFESADEIEPLLHQACQQEALTYALASAGAKLFAEF